jgi:hypothetical protein
MSGGDAGIWIYIPDTDPPGWYELLWVRNPCPWCGNPDDFPLVSATPELYAWLKVLHSCYPGPDLDLSTPPLAENRDRPGPGDAL